MKRLNRRVRLEYNSFYIAGSRDVDVPADLRAAPFARNPRCINVGCRIWHEAEIEISLGFAADFDPGEAPDFDGLILTPDQQVLLFDANHPELLRIMVETHKTRIRIWTNHPTEPDRVVVAVGD